MVAGAGAKYLFTGAVFAIAIGDATLYTPLTLTPRSLKEAGATRDSADTVL